MDDPFLNEIEPYPHKTDSSDAFSEASVGAGRYFVDGCKCCHYRICLDVAPINFSWDDQIHKAYVRRQPASPSEEAQCQKAMEECYPRAIRDSGGLHWKVAEPLAGQSDAWKLKVYIPNEICFLPWSPEYDVWVLVAQKDNAPAPRFEDFIGHGANRYLKLKTFTEGAPLHTLVENVCASIWSDDLDVWPLISKDEHGNPFWKEIDRGGMKDSSCPLLQISQGTAIGVFHIQLNETWKKQLVRPFREEWDQDFTRVKTARPVAVSFGITVAGVQLVEMSQSIPVTLMQPGPAYQHVSNFARTVFASYAEADLQVVQFADSLLRSIGIAELRWDQKVSLSGQRRGDTIKEAIFSADLFQLFWSDAARDSKYVRDEWRYALSLKRTSFVRPVYWTTPLPERPPALRDLFFAKLEYSPSRHGFQIDRARDFFTSGSVVNIERMEFVSKQVNVNTSGQGNIVNVADLISGVMNDVSGSMETSNLSKETRDLIQSLMVQVALASKTIAPEAAEQMASDIKTLSDEAKKPNPRIPWYKVSLEGLAETAKAIGEVGKPILEIVAALAPKLVL